ncbi:MAG: sulfatase-like hydrolase/transferase [Chitinivibrionales bacterium]|nr:sulfatase-like hydrolase/transferase [Chitinivibrionales bacterium]
MGFSDISSFGSEIPTPNIDSIGKEGVTFTQFYNCGKCMPTRGSIMTGLQPHQVGTAGNGGRLNTSCVTIAEVLKSAGYGTYVSGKWHMRDNGPLSRGFDQAFWAEIYGRDYFDPTFAIGGKSDHFLNSAPYTGTKPDGTPYTDYYLTDAEADFGIHFMRENKNHSSDPFFLYLSFCAPHYPIQARREDIDLFRGSYLEGWDAIRSERFARLKASGIIPSPTELTPRDDDVPAWSTIADKDKDLWDLRMSVHAAMMHRLDLSIGRVLRHLKSAGLDDNTLVMFLSDNGGTAEGHNKGTPGQTGSKCTYQPPWGNASNTPFYKFKLWVHEGGIATPFLARWPAAVKQAAKNSEPGHVMDIMATCLEASGATYPDTFNGNAIKPHQGKSLLPLMTNQPRESHPFLCWEFIGRKAVRKGNWKLVLQPDGSWTLHDMSIDRTEIHDLSARHPDVAHELKDMYNAWWKNKWVVPDAWATSVRSAQQGSAPKSSLPWTHMGNRFRLTHTSQAKNPRISVCNARGRHLGFVKPDAGGFADLKKLGVGPFDIVLIHVDAS